MARQRRPKDGHIQPEMLQSGQLLHAPLRYAPQNELGVVFLFSYFAKKWRLKIEQVRPGFPDCIGYQKIKGKERKVRIEFEFRSRNFKAQGHPASKCDWIVCWEHNWPDAPKRLRIVELRREFGLGFNVWIQAVSHQYKARISTINSSAVWSFAKSGHRGDLILFYHASRGGSKAGADRCIKDIFKIDGPGRYVRSGYKKGRDWQGPIRRVCQLDAPVFLEDLQRDRILRTAGFVRGSMQGRPNATEYWPYLYDLIVRRNPSSRKKLSRYSPEK